MGEVWVATDTLLARPVAVKILKEEYRSAPTFLERFRAEARHAGQLNHPGIAAVYDYGETADLAFLVMELVDGQPLSEVMVAQPGMSDIVKLSILAQAADALNAAHDAGVVHRDVKPGNLMVRPDGAVKVTDFGIARALTSVPLTENGQMMGTPAYLSPEQASGDRVTGASDIYSLGVVAYEMFAGRPPFERDSLFAMVLAQVHDAPPPLPDSVPRGIAELIGSALAKDPSRRPPSAADFASKMRRELASLRSAATIQNELVGRTSRTTATPTVVSSAATSPVQGSASTLVLPVPNDHEARRNSYVAVAAFACLLALIGATIGGVARLRSSADAGADLSTVASTVATDASPTSSTPPPTEPLATVPPETAAPETPPPETAPLATAAPATAAPATAPPPEAPAPKPVEPPFSGVVTAPGKNAQDQVAEDEALAFVVDYYERVAAGQYDSTWESLSAEFRDDRGLTFERYVSYWNNTSIELRDLRFLSGPGADQGRVRFLARYDTGQRIVDETDEVTLRRLDDGSLIITQQRTV